MGERRKRGRAMRNLGEDQAYVQELMGCDSSCRFCDVKALGKGPCCTFPGRLVVDRKSVV